MFDIAKDVFAVIGIVAVVVGVVSAAFVLIVSSMKEMP